MLRRVLALVSQSAFALSALWLIAVALRFNFGVAITHPLFPPLALERVEPGPALLAAAAYALVGALAGRGASAGRRSVPTGPGSALAPHVECPAVDAGALPGGRAYAPARSAVSSASVRS